MELEPLFDKVLTRIPKAPENKAGIVMAQASQERPVMSDVIAVGSDVKKIKVGDRVFYTRYSPNELELEGETYIVLKEEDILARVKVPKKA